MWSACRTSTKGVALAVREPTTTMAACVVRQAARTTPAASQLLPSAVTASGCWPLHPRHVSTSAAVAARRRRRRSKRVSDVMGEGSESEWEEVSISQAMRAADNPYLKFTLNHSRSPHRPPQALVSTLDDLMHGRNIAALRAQNKSFREGLIARWRTQLSAVLKKKKAGDEKVTAPPAPLVLYGPKQTLGYAIHDLLPSFGVTTRVLQQTSDCMPEWQPATMLDVGAGPGTGIWAAREAFENDVDLAVYVDPSRSMTQVAEHVLSDFPKVNYLRSLSELTRFYKSKHFDLTMAGYVLSELGTDADREKMVRELWERTSPGGVMVLIERGNGWGFHCIQTARQLIIDSQGIAGPNSFNSDSASAPKILAPCAHANACPMHPKSWCHFAQSTYAHRTSGNTRNKSTNHMPVRSEKYSYVVIRKPGGAGTSSGDSQSAAGASSVAMPSATEERLAAWRTSQPDASASAPEPPATEETGAGSSGEVDNGSDEGSDEGSGEEEEVWERSGDALLAHGDVGPHEEWARIVRKPILGGGHVLLDVCTPQGTLERRIPSKRKLKHLPGAYRAARRAQWGGLWPNELSLTKRQQQQAAEAGRAGNITTDAQDSDTSDDGVGDM